MPNKKPFTEPAARSVSTHFANYFFKEAAVGIQRNDSYGDFVRVQVRDDIRIDVFHESGTGWVASCYKTNKSGTKSKNFGVYREVLIANGGNVWPPSSLLIPLTRSLKTFLDSSPLKTTLQPASVEFLVKSADSYLEAQKKAKAAKEIAERKEKEASSNSKFWAILVAAVLFFLIFVVGAGNVPSGCYYAIGGELVCG